MPRRVGHLHIQTWLNSEKHEELFDVCKQLFSEGYTQADIILAGIKALSEDDKYIVREEGWFRRILGKLDDLGNRLSQAPVRAEQTASSQVTEGDHHPMEDSFSSFYSNVFDDEE